MSSEVAKPGRYDSFEGFMGELLIDISMNVPNKCPENIWSAIIKLILAGWLIFLAVAALMGLGTIAFGVALVPFMATPIGWIVAGILVMFGFSSLYKLYTHRDYILLIKETGERYKPLYMGLTTENLISERKKSIDDLYTKAREYLCIEIQGC